MADGLNDARAMRIAEVMNGYTVIQQQLAAKTEDLARMPGSASGSAILRQCINEARSLLASPLPSSNVADPPSPGEGTRTQLQALLLDAAARRFRAYRLLLRANAAMRWWQRRQQLLQGNEPSAATQPALSKVDDALRTDVLAITDQKVFQELNQSDVQANNWTAEMPSLAQIRQYNTNLH